MLPLRFHNSGIKAKVFVRKIDFKLRVMRLHRVELFYAFLLRFRSEGNKERGWVATPRPSARVAGHGTTLVGGLADQVVTRGGDASP
ncbi:hypothetical protein GW17_00056558 [Ensete ventricosum]|nr:hypothetical protein GW17_00056558 [Ensete ventricosum]